MSEVNLQSSPLITSAIAAGERAGRLPTVLADLDAAFQDRLGDEAPGLIRGGGFWLYPFILVLTCLMVVTYLMVFVVPKFREIFLDYDVALPAVTVSLINTCQWLNEGPFVVLVALLVAMVLALLAASWAFPALRERGEPVVPAILDLFGWIPVVSRPISFGRGMALSIRVVRAGLMAGMTLPASASLAAALRVNRYLQHRWQRFSEVIQTGVPAAKAALDVGLGGVFARACQDLERGDSDPQLVLDHVANYHRAIALRWWGLFARLAWPAVTCLLGCLVGYVVLAMFLPLISLINSVSGSQP